MKILADIQYHLKQTNAVEKIIYANLLLFIVSILFPVFVTDNFSLSSGVAATIKQPWTIISYAFIHLRLFHILSNLLVLYYIGQLFLDFFSEKKFIIYYFLSLILGGFLFIAYYSISGRISHFSLIGASAAVTGILIGLATKIPHYAIRLRFIGNVELWVLAAIWIVLSAFTAAGINAGSGVAHLGGALTGFLLTSYFNEGKISVRLKKSGKPFKKVYKNKVNTTPSYRQSKANQQQVDAILDKISKSGYDALSKEEKEFLFNQKSE